MAEPKRFRLTIPAADTSVLAWMDAQQNVSYSIRQLIRDAIRRDGYVDVTCSEVQQLPKRGRPPKEEDEPVSQQPEAPVSYEPRYETPAKPQPALVRQETSNRDEDGFVDPSDFFGH